MNNFTEELTLILDIIHGKYGIGESRVKVLEDLGYDYEAVQKAVNDYMLSSTWICGSFDKYVEIPWDL